MLRGSREFESVEAYRAFVAGVVTRRKRAPEPDIAPHVREGSLDRYDRFFGARNGNGPADPPGRRRHPPPGKETPDEP